MSYIAVADANDLITNMYDYDAIPNYDLKQREWYINTIEEGKTTITAPYIDMVTGKRIISITAPIEDRGQISGVFGLDVMIEDINTMMSDYRIGDKGYAVLVYKNGEILYHPDYDTTDPLKKVFLKDLVGGVSKELLSGESGMTSYTFQEVEKYIAFLPIKNTNLIVLTIIPKSEVFHQLNKFMATNLCILIGLVAVVTLLLIFLNNFISTPVVRISREIENYRNDKYTCLPQKYLSREDEIGILSRELSFMLQENSNYVLEIEEKNQKISISKEKISREHLLFKTTIQSLGDGVIATDKFGKIKIMNNVAENLTGWSMQEAEGKDFNKVFNIINEFTREIVTCPVQQVLELNQAIQLEDHTFLINKTGEEIPIEDSAAPIVQENGSILGAVIVFRDFSDKKRKQDKIEFLSYHDQLTGLYNRRFYEEELRKLDIKQNLPLTIVMGDVNGLKLINDSFGHVMGDELLKKVAEVIKKGCRDDDIIARLGGDEFVILLSKTDAFEAEQIIKRIDDMSHIEKAELIDISISFGYETKNNEEEDIQEIFKKAEDKMYEKKNYKREGMRKTAINPILISLHEKSKREDPHSNRVSQLCERMGVALGLPEYDIIKLKLIALLHDIGKIAIDENILNKPGKLTDREWEEIKCHSEMGYRIISTANDTSDMARCVLSHHERWDGKGYPKGLKEKEIPFVSRIIAIADAYDAMTSERSYRSALPEEVAVQELQKNAGTQFDSQLTSIFIEKVLGKSI